MEGRGYERAGLIGGVVMGGATGRAATVAAAVAAEIRWEGAEEVRGDRFGVGRRPLR